MKIRSAEFITSSITAEQYPKSRLPEVALLGRSNVGKSSALNSLFNRKGLAKVGKTPGKTQMINFFRVSLSDQAIDQFHVVDLPGYGYAKVPDAVRKQWRPMVEGYLSKRETLCGVVIFVDIRRTEQVDKDLVNWLQGLHLPQVIVLTKADKLGSGKRKEALRRTRQELSLSPETELLLYSAHTHEGRLDVMHALKNLLMART